jgi:hypothetical protein
MPRYAAEGGMMTAEPVHMALGGMLKGAVEAIAKKIAEEKAAAAEEKAQADRIAEIQNSYRPPMQSMQPQVQQHLQV